MYTIPWYYCAVLGGVAKWGYMGRYSALVGKRVEAHYRAGDKQLSATGTLVMDSGKAIFIEERFSQGGKQKTLRVEIPYEFIAHVTLSTEPAREDPPRPLKKHS